jgi:DNA-binding LytR/AlgR family response regulator
MKYKIIICDDEKLHMEILSNEIEKYFANSNNKYEKIEVATGKELLECGGIATADIAFLDIELEDMKGIELSRKLREINDKVLIIFVTSHPDYALEAFEQFVFNYIMKPIDSKKFKRIMNKALENIENRRKSSVEKFFNIIYKKKMTSIPYKKIVLFEKKVNNLVILLENNNLEIRRSLKKIEEEIDMNCFLRCHRSFIVNKEKIIAQHGNYLTLIGHNEKIPIGEKYRDHVNIEISKMLRGRRG